MSYLQQMPIGEVKIDKSFITNLPDSSGDLAIVSTLASMAKALGMKTVAEGVETISQVSLLESLGVDCVQGYYFGHPAPLSELVKGWRTGTSHEEKETCHAEQ